jgi:hypothetical protein
VILEQVNGDEAHRLDRELTRVNALVSDITADRRQIATAAQSAAEVVDQVAHRISDFHFDSQASLQLMRRISGAGDWISGQGERSAEQAVMILNSLVVAYHGNTKENPEQAQMKAAVASLFQLVENPAAYNPSSFAGQMRVFNALVR